MKVNELIEELKKYDGELEVNVNGGEIGIIFLSDSGERKTLVIKERNVPYTQLIDKGEKAASFTLRSLLDRADSPLQIYTGVTHLDTETKWEVPDMILSRASVTSLSEKLLDEDVDSIEAHHNTLLVKIIRSYHQKRSAKDGKENNH